MSKTLSSEEIKKFKKDINNLSKDNCLEAVKLYEKSNGKIPYFINPIAKRIKIIYKKCLGNFKSKKPINDKNSLDKSKTQKIYNKKLDKLPKPKIDKKKLDKLKIKDVMKIIEQPMMNTNDISKITLKIFGEDNKINEQSLKKHLENEDIEVSEMYRKSILEIKKYIKDFCPFMGNKNFSKSVKIHLGPEYTNEPGIFLLSPKLNDVFDNVHESINETMMYSSTNKNTDDFKNNLKNNFPKYFCLKYMLNIFEKYSITTGVINVTNLCNIMEKLINYDKLIIKNKTNNLQIKTYEQSIYENNVETIYNGISISFKINNKTSYPLFEVYIHNKFKKNKSLIPKEYSFDKLFKTILKLVLEGKLFGKSMPYKMHRVLTRYNQKRIHDKDEYIDFCKLYYSI